jgi:hypothetical protein
MHIRRDQLKLGLPGKGDGVLVGRTGLIVQVWRSTERHHQTRCDGVLCSNGVGVAPAFEGLLEDEIAIRVIGNHDILVARAGLHGELSRVVHEELADGDDADVDLIGWEC